MYHNLAMLKSETLVDTIYLGQEPRAKLKLSTFCIHSNSTSFSPGLLDMLSTEAELAAVLAHETAHVLARHHAERMTQQSAPKAVSLVIAHFQPHFSAWKASPLLYRFISLGHPALALPSKCAAPNLMLHKRTSICSSLTYNSEHPIYFRPVRPGSPGNRGGVWHSRAGRGCPGRLFPALLAAGRD